MKTLLVLILLSALHTLASARAKFDPCTSNPCHNGGTCSRNKRGTKFHCECPPLYSGEFCEQCEDEDPEQCQKWKAQGYCQTEKPFTREKCRRSCYNCRTGPCTKFGEFCVHQAFCNENKECQCGFETLGDGRLVCAQGDDNLCMIRPDPQLETYGGANGNINFPCRYRLSHVSTELPKSIREPGKEYCQMEVFGYGLVSRKGHHYPDAAEVRITLGDYDQNDAFRPQSHANLDFGLEGATFSSNSTGGVRFERPWNKEWNGLDIACLFDLEDKVTIVDIPACHFRLVFRSYNESLEELDKTQIYTPGIAVVTGKDAVVKELDRYPNSLCGLAGRRGDGENVLVKHAANLGLDSVDQVLLFDALSQDIPQRSLVNEIQNVVLQNADSCQRSVDVFRDCGGKQKHVEAVKFCFPLVSSKNILRCLGPLVMDVFSDCLSVFCNDERAQECQRMSDIFAAGTGETCAFPDFLQERCTDSVP